jgi:hypothetical protein
MNQDERRERAAGITTAMFLGGIAAACIIKLIFTLVY